MKKYVGIWPGHESSGIPHDGAVVMVNNRAYFAPEECQKAIDRAWERVEDVLPQPERPVVVVMFTDNHPMTERDRAEVMGHFHIGYGGSVHNCVGDAIMSLAENDMPDAPLREWPWRFLREDEK